MANPIPLQPGRYYHIYNRGNNREDIFVEERNYTHFLGLYAHHVEPAAETYAYCLLRNHFHLLVKIKDLSGLKPSQCFSNLFNAYTKAINKAYQRTGALFQRPFGRIEIATDAHFLQLVAYIHRNPQKHGFVSDFRSWPYSSYPALLSEKPTRLQRDTVMAWFDGRESFESFHRQEIEGNMKAWSPDDEGSDLTGLGKPVRSMTDTRRSSCNMAC